MAVSFLAYAATLWERLYFRRSHFFRLLQSNHFDTTITFSEQLFLQSSYFFWGAPFFRTVNLQRSYFFRILLECYFFSYFFRAKNLLRNYYLRIGSSLWKLLFGTATFEERNCLELRHVQMSYFYVAGPPRWNSPCRSEGAYPPRSFNQSASKRRAEMSIATKTVRSTDLPNHNVKTWVNTDKIRLERLSLVKAPRAV